jgi:hypothetical protein
MKALVPVLGSLPGHRRIVSGVSDIGEWGAIGYGLGNGCVARTSIG